MEQDESVKRAFIRALWGDDSIERRAKVLNDIEARWLPDEYKPEPAVTYTFGRENQRWLAERGVPSELLTEDPIVDFDGLGERPRDRWGVQAHGYATWRHKTEAMARAMEQFDEIVWLDWDCHLWEPVPADFWERMGRGQPIQMSLVQYHRVHCPWRRHGKRCVPEGAFIYVRERWIVEEANLIYKELRTWTDQTVFAKLMDEMQGGWPGVEKYKQRGFEPYCHRIYNQINRPETELFVTSRGPKRGGRWAKRQRELAHYEFSH